MVTLWVSFLYLILGSETDDGVMKDNVFARTGYRTVTLNSKLSRLSLYSDWGIMS